MVLLSQPGFESGQYRDNYFCVWNLPDPKPQQKIYGFYLMHKDFHGASGDLNKCPCYDHMTVHSHREWPTTLCGGNFHPPNHQWCKRGASLCFYPGGVKYVGELNWLSMGLYILLCDIMLRYNIQLHTIRIYHNYNRILFKFTIPFMLKLTNWKCIPH